MIRNIKVIFIVIIGISSSILSIFINRFFQIRINEDRLILSEINEINLDIEQITLLNKSFVHEANLNDWIEIILLRNKVHKQLDQIKKNSKKLNKELTILTISINNYYEIVEKSYDPAMNIKIKKNQLKSQGESFTKEIEYNIISPFKKDEGLKLYQGNSPDPFKTKIKDKAYDILILHLKEQLVLFELILNFDLELYNNERNKIKEDLVFNKNQLKQLSVLIGSDEKLKYFLNLIDQKLYSINDIEDVILNSFDKLVQIEDDLLIAQNNLLVESKKLSGKVSIYIEKNISLYNTLNWSLLISIITILGVLGIFIAMDTLRFVRELKLANIKIKESEQRLNLAITGTRTGLWDWDIKKGNIYVNDEWKIIHGYKLYEINFETVDEMSSIYNKDDRKKSEKLLNMHISGKTEYYECELRFKNNHKSGWVLSRGRVSEWNENGEAVRITGTIQDITEKKKIEKKLQKLNLKLEDRVKERTKQLERSNEELETFAYSVSHDLRAPLRTIDGFSRILLNDYYNKINDEMKHYLDRISSGSKRMGQLIDDILELSRATRHKIKWEEINLSKIAEDIITTLKDNEPERKAEIKIKKNLFVKGDFYLLTSVMENLLGNAWKFTSKNEITKITFGTKKHNNKIEYFVKDNGAGFDMQYVHNLFKPFKRLHLEKDFLGTGIGLANVEKVISKHGGKVRAESKGIEKGATFYFTL